jgi:uncharacterized membrane protein YqjE
MSIELSERIPMSPRATDGIVRSGRRMLAILVSMARTRLNLLAIEIMEEKSRIWLLLLLTALCLLFTFMALLTLSLLIVVAFWEHRLLAIGGLLAFYLLAAGVSALVLRHRAKSGSPLFSSTLRELSRDADELEGASETDELDFDAGQHRT